MVSWTGHVSTVYGVNGDRVMSSFTRESGCNDCIVLCECTTSYLSAGPDTIPGVTAQLGAVLTVDISFSPFIAKRHPMIKPTLESSMFVEEIAHSSLTSVSEDCRIILPMMTSFIPAGSSIIPAWSRFRAIVLFPDRVGEFEMQSRKQNLVHAMLIERIQTKVESLVWELQ